MPRHARWSIDRHHPFEPRNRRTIPVVAAMAVGLSVIGLAPTVAGASQSNHSQPMAEINPGGGTQNDGSDGLHIVVNADGTGASNPGQDQIFFAGQAAFGFSASAPMISVDGLLYGEAGPAVTSWTNVQVLSVGGSGTTSGGSGTGSGSAHVRYTETVGGLDYVVDRTVTYHSPDRSFTDGYTVTVPQGNTDVVKLYLGGDTTPDADDHGLGQMVTSPLRSIYTVNPVTSVQVAFGEIEGGTPFDGAVSGASNAPYNTVRSGLDIGFSADTSLTDGGLMAQWTIPSAPGSYDRSLRQSVGHSGAELSAQFHASQFDVNTEATLDLPVVNTEASPVPDLDYTLSLPSGLSLGSTAPTSNCGGTLTAVADATTVEVANATVAANDSCLVTVHVKAAAAGSYMLDSSNLTAISGGANGLGHLDVTATGSISGPPASPPACAANEGWTAIRDQVSRLYGATLGRSVDSGGLVYWVHKRLAGVSAMQVADSLLGSSERTGQFGQMSNSAFVDDLYQQVLNRAPDGDGHTYWVTQLDGGLSRADLALYMSDSAENVARTGTLAAISDEDALVCRLYQTILHRSPDGAGLSYWSTRLAGGEGAIVVADAILGSPEAAALAAMSDSDFVDSLFQGSLGRTADTNGRNYWAQVTATTGRGTVAVELANSWELQSS